MPQWDNEMKAFLGLANYFSDHVEGFATMAAPLNELITAYEKKKHKRIQYTEVDIAAFHALKEAIVNSQKLHFVDPTLPIYIATDASEYAYGAYAYQVSREGKQLPIRFISRKFTKEERKWAIPDKEAYALYYGVTQSEYLLRDVNFIILTDHDNLVHLNNSIDKKVARWKIAIQAYDAEIVFLEGKLNVESYRKSSYFTMMTSPHSLPISTR